MDAASDLRRMALRTLAEVEPTDLADELQRVLGDASMLPGVVTTMTADALGGHGTASRAQERAVGVQLSYEGLRMTRELIRAEERYDAEDPTESYLSLVASEVLVARGFSDLAETSVADEAIDIVQRFSRNQTRVYDAADSVDRSLEYDVIVLAVRAGATTVHDAVPPGVQADAERLATELADEPLPPATEAGERIRTNLATAVSGEDPVLLND